MNRVAELGNEHGGDQQNRIALGDEANGPADRLQHDSLNPPIVKDNRMVLTEEERVWAKEIKAAVEHTPELDSVSDFMYAQMAIVSMTNMDDATIPCVLERFQGMQSLREENGILDCYRQGCQSLDNLILKLIPGSILAYSYLEEDGAYICSIDMTVFDMDVLSDPEKVKGLMGASYYQFHAFNPDFKATRKGLTYLVECEGYHWKGQDMVQTKVFRRWWEELALVYPFHVQKVKYFHTGLFLNLLMSTARRFLPRHVQRRMEIGCQSEGGRLDQMFLTPTAQVANNRLVGRLQKGLEKHYDNEAIFVL